jgi:arylsulfatase A-like enzyme
MYEHSLRPPLIMVGPDIPAGEKRDAAVYIQDIMPTVMELAGGQVPAYVEFSSLKPFIVDAQLASHYPEVYGAYMDLQRMIRVSLPIPTPEGSDCLTWQRIPGKSVT